MAGKDPANIEQGGKELPYAEGGRVVQVEIGEERIGEGRDSPPSSNPSDDIGGAAARLASCSGQ